MAHQLVTGVLIRLTAVAIAEILEAELHGREHGVVVVHRGVADPRILRESVAAWRLDATFRVGCLSIAASMHG